MEPRIREDPRDRAAEAEVKKLVAERPGELDFFDVVNMVPARSRIMKGEAKAALVHMINDCELVENPNGTIQPPKRQ